MNLGKTVCDLGFEPTTAIAISWIALQAIADVTTLDSLRRRADGFALQHKRNCDLALDRILP
jgi:hypothetical protein